MNRRGALPKGTVSRAAFAVASSESFKAHGVAVQIIPPLAAVKLVIFVSAFEV